MSASPTLVVYLDRYHLGDPLFIQRLASSVRAHEGPLLLVHGSGEAAERALEAEGLPVERAAGRLRVDGPRERALVERAARELNRRIVAALNDAGVPALRIAGTDRGLLRPSADGALAAGRVDWLRVLVRQGVVPVVAALVEGSGGSIEEAEPGAAVAALALALREGAAVFFAPGRTALEGLDTPAVRDVLPEPEVALFVARKGVRARVTRPSALRGAGFPAGADLGGDPR